MYLIICDIICNMLFFPCHLFVNASSSLEAGSLHQLIVWAGTKASRRGVLAGGKAKGNEEKGTSSICHLAQLSIGSASRRQFARVILIINCSRLKAWWRFPSRGISNVWFPYTWTSFMHPALDSGCFWSTSLDHSESQGSAKKGGHQDRKFPQRFSFGLSRFSRTRNYRLLDFGHVLLGAVASSPWLLEPTFSTLF